MLLLLQLRLGQAFSLTTTSSSVSIRRASLQSAATATREIRQWGMIAATQQRPYFSRGRSGRVLSSSTATDQPTSSSQNSNQPPQTTADATPPPPVSLYRSEGVFAVEKPLNWTSQDVVSCIRGALERDARQRGAKVARVGSRRRHQKNRIVRVGHGGTLDPLATGVLVIGVGRGTKELESYLKGSKRYLAGVELGYETTTLDAAGNITKQAPTDHVTQSAVRAALPQFVGDIAQIPPIFSAIKKNGKKLYEHAREGTGDEIKLEPRNVTIYDCQLVEDDNNDNNDPTNFRIDVECGGGTYIRSLVRDIGYTLDTVATTTFLRRTKQGQFTEEDCLPRDDWDPDAIYAAIDQTNRQRQQEGGSRPNPTGKPDKTHTSALAWIPPPESPIYEAIQTIRQKYDRLIHRWPPHVNILYPFVPVDEFEEAAKRLALALTNTSQFDVTLEDIGHFEHGQKSCTAWLRPKETEQFAEVQRLCEEVFPHCNEVSTRGQFVPHLTVGQCNDMDDVNNLISQVGWTPVSSQCGELCLISRKGNDDPFEVHWRVALGNPSPLREQ